MKARPLLLLSCVYFVLSTDSPGEEVPIASIQWKGGVTKMDDEGRKVCNGLSTRAQISEDLVFLCNPRLKPGLEATLLKMNMHPVGDDDSSLEPFPKGHPQTEGDCNCLQSAVDASLDCDGILWVLDVGVTFSAHSRSTPRCPPKIFGINTLTEKVDHVINLEKLVEPMSRLQFIISDYSKEGHIFLYIADAGTKTIIVWDVDNNKGSRVVLPNKVLEEFKPRDVLYSVLIRKDNGSNLLFYTYRSGDNLYCVEAKELQENASAEKSWEVGKKPSRMIFLGTDDWDSFYFRFEDKADIYKWNTTDVFCQSNFHLVHRGDGVFSQTHALPDFKRGVMRMVESNLIEYLRVNVKPADSLNSLTVMAIPKDNNDGE